MTTVPALSDEAAINQYTATSGQTDFNFTYMIFATADIKVYVNGVLKTEVTHYNVRKSSGAAIASSDLPLDGGKVIFTSGLVLNDEVTLTREIAIARLTGYSVAGAFRADVVNAEFTKGYAVMQQLRRDLERSIRLSAYDAEGGDLTLPESRAGNFLAFDADGDLIASAGTTEVPVSAFMETLLDDPTAAAARTTLGVAIGTDVQSYDSDLAAIAALAVARGAIIYGNSSPAWAKLTVGANGQVLKSDGTDLAWGSVPTAVGSSVQVVNTQTGAVATGTTIMPLDDTIPQNTEGDQYMTLAITPTNASNILYINVVTFLSSSAAGTVSVASALFQDSTVDALAAIAETGPVATGISTLAFTHKMTAGTTSAITFKVRCGAGSAGTTTFNGSGAARIFGGVLASSITITEVKV